jgi:hypothetical protein
MKKDIIDKLRDLLAGSVDSECTVVYMLAEIRKVLYAEQLPISALRMYCHWALHVDLSHERTTRPFLERVDDVVYSILTPGVPATVATLAAENALYGEFGFLTTFRSELSQFFSAHGLPTDLCDDDDRWFAFLTAYAGVIEDGSLICQTANALKLVERVTFTKGRPTMNGHVPFRINWEIQLRDGRKCAMDVEAPADKSLIAAGFHLH